VVDSDEYDSEGFLIAPREGLPIDEGAEAPQADEEYDSEGFLLAPRAAAVPAVVPSCAEGASPFIRAWRWKREHLCVALQAPGLMEDGRVRWTEGKGTLTSGSNAEV
jgi:hypothetical protein